MDILLEELLKKYGVVYINGYRYYIDELSEKRYNYEDTIPYCIVINNVTIYDSSWKNIIPRILDELQAINKKSETELLSIKFDWSKSSAFATEKKTNYTKYGDIYVNTNHTSTHAIWFIQLLLKEYNIDLSSCKLILKRHPSSEPKEIRDYFHNKNKEDFINYLIVQKGLSKDTVDSIINTLETLNLKYLPKVSNSFNDFYLIEESSYFYNYYKKTVELVKLIKNYETKKIKMIDKKLNYLYNFMKYQHNQNLINYDQYLINKDNDTDTNPILDDFD